MPTTPPPPDPPVRRAFSVLAPSKRQPGAGVLCASIEAAIEHIRRAAAVGQRFSIWGSEPTKGWFKITHVVQGRRGLRFEPIADPPILWHEADSEPPAPLRTWSGGWVARLPGADAWPWASRE